MESMFNCNWDNCNCVEIHCVVTIYEFVLSYDFENSLL